jgi:hypothetical protein
MTRMQTSQRTETDELEDLEAHPKQRKMGRRVIFRNVFLSPLWKKRRSSHTL